MNRHFVVDFLVLFILMEDFDKTIIKLAKAFKIPPLEWEDVAQELRIHLWKNRHKYDPQKGKYKNWAYIICRNKLRNLAEYWRAQKRDPKKVVSLEELKKRGLDIEG